MVAGWNDKYGNLLFTIYCLLKPQRFWRNLKKVIIKKRTESLPEKPKMHDWICNLDETLPKI